MRPWEDSYGVGVLSEVRSTSVPSADLVLRCKETQMRRTTQHYFHLFETVLSAQFTMVCRTDPAFIRRIFVARLKAQRVLYNICVLPPDDFLGLRATEPCDAAVIDDCFAILLAFGSLRRDLLIIC